MSKLLSDDEIMDFAVSGKGMPEWQCKMYLAMCLKGGCGCDWLYKQCGYNSNPSRPPECHGCACN